MLINSIKAEVAKSTYPSRHPPKVLTAGALIGSEKATSLFQAAYDEHGHRNCKNVSAKTGCHPMFRSKTLLNKQWV